MLVFKILFILSALGGFLAQKYGENDRYTSVDVEATQFLGRNVRNTRVGPIVIPTVGQIWPKPLMEFDYVDYLSISADSFAFEVNLNRYCICSLQSRSRMPI